MVRAAQLLLALGFLAILTPPVARVVLTRSTRYVPGYTEPAFDSIALGDDRARVLAALGPPLSSTPSTPSSAWLYCDPSHPGYGEDGGISGTFTEFTFGPDGRVRSVFGQVETVVSKGLSSRQTSATLGENHLGIPPNELEALKGKTRAEIEGLYGRPTHRRDDPATEILVYSRSPSSTHYRLRQIGMDASGTVVSIGKYVYWD